MTSEKPSPSSILIYCDGACLGNPGPGAAAWIVATSDQVMEGVERASETTNNRMEILALVRALDYVNNLSTAVGAIHVFTDSQYLIQALQSWLYAWRKRGWITAGGDPVKNRDLWEMFNETALQRLCLHHVRGHQGIPGNERCDTLANGAASGLEVTLYRGPRSAYPVDLLAKAALEPAPRGEPYYLSALNGKIYRDTTWKACEARVKGHRGAKYKKVHSSDEELQVLQAWGLVVAPKNGA